MVKLLPPTSEVSSSNPGNDGSFFSMVGSLQNRTLTNCMYWFPVLIKLPVII